VLRVLINVPQENAPTVRPGQPAVLFVQEFSKRSFPGKVTRTSNSLDQTSRTLLTEVQVSNPQSLLLPGMYALIQFSDRRLDPPLLVPGESVIADANGLHVAMLQDLTVEDRRRLAQHADEARRIHMQKVEVGRDYGPQIEITSGLQGWEYLVVNPGDIAEGSLVLPRFAPPVAGQGSPERRGPSGRHASGLGSPSMVAPTEGGPKGGGGKQ
jgi:multidrug efflux pump subunit AcrA (membrane-fusion protein)